MRVLVAALVAASLVAPNVALAAAKSPPPPNFAAPPPPVLAAPPAPPPEAPKKPEVPPPPPATPDRVDLARQIVAAQGGAPAFNSMLDGLCNGVLETLKPQPAISSMITPYKDKILGVLHNHMPAIAEAVSLGWARAYSADELRGQLAWYGSPTGQSIASKLPRLLSDLGREFGWVLRQILIVDPKAAQYLADVSAETEGPLAWTPASPGSEAKIRAVIAEADKDGKMARAFEEMKKKPPGVKKNEKNDKMTQRVIVLLPQVGKDLIAIVGSTFTEDEIQAQMDFAASPTGKATAAGADRLEAGMKEEFKPLSKAISKDMAAVFKGG